MLTPVTARDWVALFVITVLGIAALAVLLPLSLRMPFLMPLEMYERLMPYQKYANVTDFTPVAVGVADVTVCCFLYGGWMSWSNSHPVMRAARKRRPEE